MIIKYKYIIIPEQGKVIAISRFAGKPVRGVAKCADTDTFDVEKGKILAAARCNKKIAIKRHERADRKFHEAWAQLRAAKKHYADMCDYLEESLDAFERAEDDLADLLAEY